MEKSDYNFYCPNCQTYSEKELEINTEMTIESVCPFCYNENIISRFYTLYLLSKMFKFIGKYTYNKPKDSLLRILQPERYYKFLKNPYKVYRKDILKEHINSFRIIANILRISLCIIFIFPIFYYLGKNIFKKR